MYNDFVEDPSAPAFSSISAADAKALLAIPRAKSYADKSIEKTFVGLSKSHYAKHVQPSMECAQRCGNMYTASLYGGLASLLSTVTPEVLKGKRIAMFAFGSGCASSYWGITVKGDTSEIRSKLDLMARLEAMKVVPCEEFVEALKVRILPAFDRRILMVSPPCRSVNKITTRHLIHQQDRLTMSGLGAIIWSQLMKSSDANTRFPLHNFGTCVSYLQFVPFVA